MTNFVMTLILDRDSLDGEPAGTVLGEIVGPVIPDTGSAITVEDEDVSREYVVHGADNYSFIKDEVMSPPRLVRVLLYVVKRGLSPLSQEG